MKRKNERPEKISRVGGREFHVYRQYDEQLQAEYLTYPDFKEYPEYTDEGRPFSTAVDEGCPYYKPPVLGEPGSDDCGGCGWFHREAPYDIIGICMCDANRQNQ